MHFQEEIFIRLIDLYLIAQMLQLQEYYKRLRTSLINTQLHFTRLSRKNACILIYKTSYIFKQINKVMQHNEKLCVSFNLRTYIVAMFFFTITESVITVNTYRSTYIVIKNLYVASYAFV